MDVALFLANRRHLSVETLYAALLAPAGEITLYSNQPHPGGPMCFVGQHSV